MDEFALIERFFRGLGSASGGVSLGIGDDAALLRPNAGMELAVTTDTLIQGRHFDAQMRPQDLAWKALAVNLSDLAAMGACPRWFTLALSMPTVDKAWLEAFSQGLATAADVFELALVGGDTTRGPLSLGLTALGEVPIGGALRRDGAKAGDLICVSGTLGDAALALRLARAPEALASRLSRPTPRVSLGRKLVGYAHAAIDLSDGLLQDLGHILKASGVGAEIALDQIPVSPMFAQHCEPERRSELILAGGDDYELCVCIPEAAFDRLEQALPTPLTRIGRIVKAPGTRVLNALGDIIETPLSGYRHFE